MGTVDVILRNIGSEGHGFDFMLHLENGEPMAAAAVAVAAAMLADPVVVVG